MKARGMGRIYLRGNVWWVQYSVRGKPFRKTSRSRQMRDAVKLLQLRQGEMARGRSPGHDAEKVTFDDLVELYHADYIRKGNRTWDRSEHALKHVRPVFGDLPATAINFANVSRYIAARIDAGAARGTIHHERAALGRMLKLGVLAGLLPNQPPLPTLKLDNVRKGFFVDEDVIRVLHHLPQWFAAAIEFGWRTGWRPGEVKALKWPQVDWVAQTVRLEPGTTKNREGREFPFGVFPALSALLHRQLELTQAWQREHGQILPWVFWRNGRQLGDHRDTWRRACREAGLPGKLVYDLRRSAVRNLVRAGVFERAAMYLTGHKTRSVFDRYNIVSNADHIEAVRKLAAFQQGQPGTQDLCSCSNRGTSTVPAQSAPPEADPGTFGSSSG